MNAPIPSPILARIQVMFGAGATVEEVAEAIGVELTDQEGEWLVGSAAVDAAHLEALKGHTAALGKKVSALFQLKKLNDVPEVAGALDLIAHEARAVMREARALEAKPGEGAGDAISEPAVRKSKPGRRKSAAKKNRPAQPSPSVGAASRESEPSRTRSSAPSGRRAGAGSSPNQSATAAAVASSKPAATVSDGQTPPPLPGGFTDGAGRNAGTQPPRRSMETPPPLPGKTPAPEAAPSPSPSRVRKLVGDQQPIPEGVKPAPSAPIDAPMDEPSAPSGAASRPSPGRPSRNALTYQIADVVDQISAITQVSDHDEDRPSALRKA